MSDFLATILGFIVFALVLGITVMIHEGGHFLFSKKAGILCHEFAVGMGPVICQKKKGETTYSLRAIPLGGFVSMAGEEVEVDLLKDIEKIKVEFTEDSKIKKIILVLDNEQYIDLPTFKVKSYDLIGTKEALEDELFLELEDESGNVTKYTVLRNAMVNYQKKSEIQIAPYDRTFTHKKWGQRFMSVFAGPLMNFVLALAIFFCMGLFFGYSDTSNTVLGNVSGAVVEAGLETGDRITSINGVNVNTWDELSTKMADCAKGNIAANGEINVSYVRNNETYNVTINPQIYIVSAQLIVSYVNDKVVLANGSWITGSVYESEGLLSGDVIKSIDGTAISGINDILAFFNDSRFDSAQTIDFEFEVTRNDVTNTLNLNDFEVYSKEMLSVSGYPQTKVIMGVEPGVSVDIVKLLYMPWVETANASVQIIQTFKLLFTKNSGVSITDLSGPVGILNLFTSLVKGEDAVYNILYWAGLISVNLGVINLLPLPALDGGRLAFLLYEGITKKKPTPKVENTIHNIGFILLMGLFVFIFISDIIKCFK